MELFRIINKSTGETLKEWLQTKPVKVDENGDFPVLGEFAKDIICMVGEDRIPYFSAYQAIYKLNEEWTVLLATPTTPCGHAILYQW